MINPQLLVPFMGPRVAKVLVKALILAVSKGIILCSKGMVFMKIFTNCIAPFVDNSIGLRAPARRASWLGVPTKTF